MAGPVVFRISALGHVAAITLVVCVTPVAATVPYGALLYLLPLGWMAGIVRLRTTVDGESVTARNIVRARRVAWTDITALRLRTRSRVSAVLTDGSELPLPAVRVRDLPLLAEVSDGRLPDLASPKE